MFYTMRDVFGEGKSMKAIREMYEEEGKYFSDIDALALFTDNHDHSRFLFDYEDGE